MESRRMLAFIFVGCNLVTCLSSQAVKAAEVGPTSIYNENASRDPRQLTSFFSTPIRRAASSTRDIVKFVRDYSAFRLGNSTPPDPQTTVGKRAVALLQHVTINNIRDVLNSLLNSEAAPVVAGLIKNIDRDTLQLFNGPDRTYQGIVSRRRNGTSTTTAKPGGKTDSTTSATKVKGVRPSANTTTTASLKVETTTKTVGLAGGDKRSGTANSETGKRKVIQPVNEDDEEETIEEDDD